MLRTGIRLLNSFTVYLDDYHPDFIVLEPISSFKDCGGVFCWSIFIFMLSVGWTVVCLLVCFIQGMVCFYFLRVMVCSVLFLSQCCRLSFSHGTVYFLLVMVLSVIFWLWCCLSSSGHAIVCFSLSYRFKCFLEKVFFSLSLSLNFIIVGEGLLILLWIVKFGHFLSDQSLPHLCIS